MASPQLYFLAITPPAPIYEQVMEIKTHMRQQYNCKAPLRSPPHITLQMPFRWSEDKELELINQLNAFAENQSPFSLQLNGFQSFEPRVIYIDVMRSESLNVLQKALAKHIRQEVGIFNADYKDRGFHPHMTVAFRDLKKPLFYQAWDEFRDKSFTADFDAGSFWLLKHDGKKWEPKEEFFLGH